jgi:hypothetical protein
MAETIPILPHIDDTSRTNEASVEYSTLSWEKSGIVTTVSIKIKRTTVKAVAEYKDVTWANLNTLINDDSKVNNLTGLRNDTTSTITFFKGQIQEATLIYKSKQGSESYEYTKNEYGNTYTLRANGQAVYTTIEEA